MLTVKRCFKICEVNLVTVVILLQKMGLLLYVSFTRFLAQQLHCPIFIFTNKSMAESDMT